MKKERTFVVAEAGINHNGKLELAKKLADMAKWVGADAVKYQTYRGAGFSYPHLAIPYDKTLGLKDYCDSIGIEFMSSGHSIEAIKFLNPIVKRHKVASQFLGDKEYLQMIAGYNKPILLSVGDLRANTGMASDKRIMKALSWIPNADVTLLHCVSKYPCHNPHYERIEELKKFGKPVGLSDHFKSTLKLPDVPVIEKHIMLEGVSCMDEPVSLIPSEFKLMVETIHEKDMCSN